MKIVGVGHLSNSVGVSAIAVRSGGGDTVESILCRLGLPIPGAYCVVYNGQLVLHDKYHTTTVVDDGELKLVPLVGGG